MARVVKPSSIELGRQVVGTVSGVQFGFWEMPPETPHLLRRLNLPITPVSSWSRGPDYQTEEIPGAMAQETKLLLAGWTALARSLW
jgi:endoglucanase Acf2